MSHESAQRVSDGRERTWADVNVSEPVERADRWARIVQTEENLQETRTQQEV